MEVDKLLPNIKPKPTLNRRLFYLLIAASPFLLLALMSLLTSLTGNSSIVIGLDSEKIAVAGTDTALAVNYADIIAVDTLGAFQIGECVEGKLTQNTCEGVFFNESFGQYTLLAYAGTPEYIRIEHIGGILIVGCENADTTTYYYEQLCTKLSDL